MTKAEIQFVKSLSDKRTRMEERLFIAEGEKLISEILLSRLRIRKIYSLEGVFEEEESQERVSAKEMERISQLKTPSKALALVEMPNYNVKLSDLKEDLVLVLDDVQNPGNLGTIIRIADWFGIRHIIASTATADCFNPKVVQATMGAILRVEVHYTELSPLLEKAKEAGIPIFGTFLEGENIYQADLPKKGIIVMGNEGRGIREQTAKSITRKILIPPYPANRHGSESLNVAMATSIVCSEFRRRG